MTGDCHVRFCEGLAGKLRWSTRQQIELGERLNNAIIRKQIKCDYNVAKLAMDVIDKLYIPKNPQMKSFF